MTRRVIKDNSRQAIGHCSWKRPKEGITPKNLNIVDLGSEQLIGVKSRTMIDQKLKTIGEVPLIVSLLKEAIFLRSQCRVTSSTATYAMTLTTVQEVDSRDKATNSKKIIFYPEITNGLEVGQTLKCEIPISCFVVSFETTVLGLSDMEVRATFPSALDVIQRRSSGRSLFNGKAFSTVLIRTKEHTAECDLLLLNTSANGYGGILKIKTEIGQPEPGAEIFGQIDLGSYLQEIKATILHAKKIKRNNDKTNDYFVGLKNSELITAPSESDRRNAIRLVSKNSRTLVLTSEATQKTFELEANELSISGFSGNLTKGAEFFFPVGTLFREEQSSRVFKLVGATQTLARFSLVSSNLSGRMEWASRVLADCNTDISQSRDATDLVRLFTEAGAINHDVFQRTAKHWSKFEQNYRDTKIQNHWVFRCLNYRDGKLSGHVSGIRFSDTHWFIGDGAGGYTKESKIDPTFIPRYFRAFREFSHSVSPAPKVLMIWKKGHAFWKDFEEHLRKISDVATAVFHYSPLLPFRVETEKSDINFHRILPNQFSEIRHIRKQIHVSGILPFVEAFDFDEFRFGSPLLGAVNDEFLGASFRRQYFRVHNKDFEALVVLTLLPVGISVNQVVSSAYVFKISGDETKIRWVDWVSKIQEIGIENGIEPSSIRRVSDENGATIEGEGYSSCAFIADGQALAFYEKLLKEAA